MKNHDKWDWKVWLITTCLSSNKLVFVSMKSFFWLVKFHLNALKSLKWRKELVAYTTLFQTPILFLHFRHKVLPKVGPKKSRRDADNNLRPNRVCDSGFKNIYWAFSILNREWSKLSIYCYARIIKVQILFSYYVYGFCLFTLHLSQYFYWIIDCVE